MTQLRYLAEEKQFLKKTSCKTYLAMTLWNQFLSNDYIKTFHTSTSPSKPVDIICLPSGENHTHAIACECPFYSLIHFPDEYSQSLTIPREPPVTKYLPSFEIATLKSSSDSFGFGDEARTASGYTFFISQ